MTAAVLAGDEGTVLAVTTKGASDPESLEAVSSFTSKRSAATKSAAELLKLTGMIMGSVEKAAGMGI